MDEPPNTPGPNPTNDPIDPGESSEPEISAETPTGSLAELAPAIIPHDKTPEVLRAAAFHVDSELRKRGFRNNLFILLGLALAAFILASWILVRVDAQFGMFSSGPQEIVRAQLRALDRGELRSAYDMFSARYREQVSFDTWHELFVTHWRMFHAAIVRAETPPQTGAGVTLEIYLRGADDKEYRARFTLIRSDGHWWIDDVHWTQEPDQREISHT
ncbi:MAG TPA: DUF4864 domain-containing protein [Candidatus Acidoferrales bacterium]|jgi:hypothetical protein